MKKKFVVIPIILTMTFSTIFTSCAKKTVINAPIKQAKAENVVKIVKGKEPSKNPASAKNRKDTIVIGSNLIGGNFICYYAQTLADTYVSYAASDGLVDWDDAGNPIPGIAKKWDISKDGLTYTFHLRDDVKFSDGTPLTADDVKFTLQFLCDSTYSGGTDPSAMGIKGWKEYNKGTAKDVEGLKVIDKHTISVTLEKRNSSILYLIGTSIISKEYFGKDYKQGNTKGIEARVRKPIGCGPYRVVKYIPGQEVDLTANKYYWKGEPKTKNIIFKVTTTSNNMQNLESGETDIDTFDATPENISQLKALGFVDYTIYPSSSISYIGVNCKNPMFSDKRVRQAIEYGLNREQMVKTLFKGNAFVYNEPQSKAHPSYVNDVNQYKYNPSKANKLLDEAGWKKGSDGIREKEGVKFKIHILCSSTSTTSQSNIPIVKACLRKLGIELEPQIMDLNTLLGKMRQRKFEAYFMGTAIGSDVLSSDLSANFQSDAPNNYNGYSNAEVDKLINEAYSENDIKKRTVIEQKIYRKINEDLPFLFTYQAETLWACNSRISGIKFLPYKYYPYFLYQAEIK
ncbi:ABC transporter substrate-binding protein [Clostridium oryzae]|uniref:Oligopeptide-binding protein AppA n=1 Tax=Clostridium oryzae TaxID=1450648 RepID=A0A1V4IL71_9CLOT|nr:ABC transporter substrate-binding protein [Clostridium oryzae]OPJ60788.1 oligopeptide-binding protein AppA precursor [Clostridium oryzae]